MAAVATIVVVTLAAGRRSALPPGSARLAAWVAHLPAAAAVTEVLVAAVRQTVAPQSTKDDN